jgi:hypothetical protein
MTSKLYTICYGYEISRLPCRWKVCADLTLLFHMSGLNNNRNSKCVDQLKPHPELILWLAGTTQRKPAPEGVAIDLSLSFIASG